MTSGHARAADAGSRGFTLVEVIVVVGIVGIIAASLAMTFSIIVRTTPPTEARANDARSLVGISTWLPSDVSATPRAPLAAPTDHWDDHPDRASGCGGTDRGTNVLRLQWREAITGSPTIYAASYRLVDEGDHSSLIRVTCRNGGSRQENPLTAGLPPATSNPISIAWKTEVDLGVEYIVGVELEITTFEGDTLRVDAASRNPSATLSTIAGSVTTTLAAPAPTSTTSTTTTTATTTSTTTTTTLVGDTTTTAPPNAAPMAAPATVTVDPGVTTAVDLPVGDDNGDALSVTVSGVPDGWSVTTTTEDALATEADLLITTPPNETPNTYQFTYTVSDPGGAAASAMVSVAVNRIPCVASFQSISPNPVANTAGGNGNGKGNQIGQLVQAVTVTVNKSGNCSELALRYTRVTSAPGGQASDDDRQPQIKVFGDSIVVTLHATPTERWQEGDRALELVEFPGLPQEIVHGIRDLQVT